MRVNGCSCVCKGKGRKGRKRRTGKRRTGKRRVKLKGGRKKFASCMASRLKGKHYRNRTSQKMAFKKAARVCRK